MAFWPMANSARATGRVYLSSVWATTSGQRKLFQRAEEGQDAQRRQGGPAQRQDDAAEDPQLAGAVDPSGVDQVVGQARDVLPHQEHAERGDQERQDQPGQGVGEPGVGASTNSGTKVTTPGTISVPSTTHEQHVPAREVELGQGVAEHRAEEQVAHGDDEGDDRGVHEVVREVALENSCR